MIRRSGPEIAVSDYETDVLVWSERQADLLRRMSAGERVNDQVDWDNVAEEIESVGSSQRAALASQVRRILLHLMKLEASPAVDPRRGWRDSVRLARAEIDDLLTASPSLRRTVDAAIARQLPIARSLVAAALADHGETPRVKLADLQYDADAVLRGAVPEGPDEPA